MAERHKHILPLIVFAQFGCTSLWFAGNAVLADMQQEFSYGSEILGLITSSVQFGFIAGTLLFAILLIADRFSPSKVFFWSAMAGGGVNLLLLATSESVYSLLAIRFLTGVCLAGIYPVGMKIASDYYEKGLGKALGFLLGALVLGTAFPHLLRSAVTGYSWEFVILFVSLFSWTGGLLILLFVPNGPFRKFSRTFDFKAFVKLFNLRAFRQASLGYFGHMWELYAFWTFVPLVISHFLASEFNTTGGVGFFSFLVIGIGSLSCVAGGFFSLRFGSARIAFLALLMSGLCCLLSPILLQGGAVVVASFLLIWGMAVIADSPQFSTLVANSAPAELRGSGLTIMNCFGFSLTIVSIELLNYLRVFVDLQYLFLFLLPGPVLGLIALSRRGWHKRA